MKPADYTLYLVTDALDRYPRGMIAGVESAIAGGVTIVQYRGSGYNRRRQFEEARELRASTRRHGVVFIVNDAVDLALAVAADGVHLGWKDLPTEVARRVLGDGAIIGLSITAREQLAAVDGQAADYFGVGPVFPTRSKADASPAMGLEGLREIVAAASRPCVAIGGIDVARAPEVFATGVAGVAVVSALSMADDPAAVARQLRAAAGGARGA